MSSSHKKIAWVVIILLLISGLAALFYYFKPPEYVYPRGGGLGIYATSYLGANEGPVLEVPENAKLRYLSHQLKWNEFEWLGPVKVQYEGVEGWVSFRELSEESKAALGKSARF